MQRSRKVTWEEVERLSLSVAKMIQNTKFQPAIILAVARGGLVPATIIASALDVKDIIVCNVRAYNQKKERLAQPELLHSLPKNLIKQKSCLVIDELVDSGATLTFISNLLKETNPDIVVKFAVLHYKTSSKFHPDFYAKVVLKDAWLQYSWEIRNSV